MPTAKPSAVKAARKTSASAAPDAVQLLSAEHKEVKALFKAYDKLVKGNGADEDKQTLVDEICAKLTVHASTEEEIFYPAARDVLGKSEGLIDEAEVEHATGKELIAQLQAASPRDDLYDAKVKVLSEYIDHHVKEEEDEIFPKAKKAGLDMTVLGAQISARKQELMAELDAEKTADEAI